MDVEPRPLRVRLAAWRPIVLLGVLALVLATLGAAAAPPHRMTRLLVAGGQAAAAFVLGPDSLYTAQYGNNPNSESSVREFSLADGSLRWAAALSQNVENLVLDASAHVLMGRSASDPKVIFLDADSGETLWRIQSADIAVIGLARGRVLTRVDLGTGNTTLGLADARTGRQIWTRTLAQTASLGPDDLYGDAPSRIVAVGSAGLVTVLNYADGSVLGAGDLHARLLVEADLSFDGDFVEVGTVGDRIYVSRRDGGRASLTAYSTVPFAQLWQVADGPVGRMMDCASVVCITDSHSVTAVDPANGAVRWSSQAWSFAFRYDATRLFAYDLQETPDSALLDPGTGQVLLRLGHSVAVDRIVLHSDDRLPGRTWVMVLDPADGALHAVGWLTTGVPYGCEVQGSHLACPTNSGPTMVYDLPLRLT